ncbi:MAG TPA: branched-chain amino acid ABC transporter permease [Nitriliruptorales bacterium]
MEESGLVEGRAKLLVYAAVGIAVVGLLFGVLLRDIDPLAVTVIGLQVGAVYSLVGLGLALVYKATKVLNFAQGELGTVPAFIFFLTLTGWDRFGDASDPTTGALILGTVLAILSGAVMAVLINVLIIQRLADASPVTALVATAGTAFALVASELIIFEASARKFPRYVGGVPCFESNAEGACINAFSLGGINVPWHTFIVIGVLAATAIALAIFFRTPPGIALLATAQDPFAAELQGVSVRAMSMLAWGTAGALGAIGGLLGAGVFESLEPGQTTSTFLIPAFTGAVLGGLNSMPGAVVGGLLLGVVVAFANQIVLEFGWGIPGPPQVATFAVLLLVLMFRPRGLLGKEA